METLNFWKEAIAIVVAIIGLIAVIITNTKATKRDIKNASLQGDETRSAIKDVKADTSDAKPKIDNINKNTDKIRDEVVEKIIPNLKEFANASSKIDELHKDMEYKHKLKNDVLPTLYDKDKFLTGIEKLYEDNAKLVNENYNLKTQLTESKVRISVLEAENKQLKTQLSPTDYNSSFTQEFTTG